jgi:hypothetical protein
MNPLKLLLSSVALSLGLGLLGVGCAPDTGLDATDEATESGREALSLPFVELDVTKADAPPGFTVIRKKAEFEAFFGQPMPAGLDFNKHWVLHYSMGVQPTGGYAARITSVERLGAGSQKRLSIGSLDVNPGPACMVTQALTNPQTTVRIAKQKSNVAIDHYNNFELTDCSEPDFCLSALCPEGTQCDELSDSCIDNDFCPLVRCAKGMVCDEAANACVPGPCNPDEVGACPIGFACVNHVMCITQPCPEDFRCEAVLDECAAVGGYEGSCDGSVLRFCDQGEVHAYDCGSSKCGWNESMGYYDCL